MTQLTCVLMSLRAVTVLMGAGLGSPHTHRVGHCEATNGEAYLYVSVFAPFHSSGEHKGLMVLSWACQSFHGKKKILIKKHVIVRVALAVKQTNTVTKKARFF